VKLQAVPLMYRCVDEPSACEDLITWEPATGLAEHVSDLAAAGFTPRPGAEVPGPHQ
jgi:hypothetical protein